MTLMLRRHFGGQMCGPEKLRVVRAVAVLGGLLQIFLFMCLCGITTSLVILIAFLAILSIVSHTCVPWFFKLMISLSSQCSDKLGLSLDLGSFVVGMLISTTDLAQHTLEQVDSICNFFAALFLASIGMLIHVHFH